MVSFARFGLAFVLTALGCAAAHAVTWHFARVDSASNGQLIREMNYPPAIGIRHGVRETREGRERLDGAEPVDVYVFEAAGARLVCERARPHRLAIDADHDGRCGAGEIFAATYDPGIDSEYYHYTGVPLPVWPPSATPIIETSLVVTSWNDEVGLGDSSGAWIFAATVAWNGASHDARLHVLPVLDRTGDATNQVVLLDTNSDGRFQFLNDTWFTLPGFIVADDGLWEAGATIDPGSATIDLERYTGPTGTLVAIGGDVQQVCLVGGPAATNAPRQVQLRAGARARWQVPVGEWRAQSAVIQAASGPAFEGWDWNADDPRLEVHMQTAGTVSLHLGGPLAMLVETYPFRGLVHVLPLRCLNEDGLVYTPMLYSDSSWRTNRDFRYSIADERGHGVASDRFESWVWHAVATMPALAYGSFDATITSGLGRLPGVEPSRFFFFPGYELAWALLVAGYLGFALRFSRSAGRFDPEKLAVFFMGLVGMLAGLFVMRQAPGDVGQAIGIMFVIFCFPPTLMPLVWHQLRVRNPWTASGLIVLLCIPLALLGSYFAMRVDESTVGMPAAIVLVGIAGAMPFLAAGLLTRYRPTPLRAYVGLLIGSSASTLGLLCLSRWNIEKVLAAFPFIWASQSDEWVFQRAVQTVVQAMLFFPLPLILLRLCVWDRATPERLWTGLLGAAALAVSLETAAELIDWADVPDLSALLILVAAFGVVPAYFLRRRGRMYRAAFFALAGGLVVLIGTNFVFNDPYLDNEEYQYLGMSGLLLSTVVVIHWLRGTARIVVVTLFLCGLLFWCASMSVYGQSQAFFRLALALAQTGPLAAMMWWNPWVRDTIGYAAPSGGEA